MYFEQRAVFTPRLAWIFAERLLHWKEQFRWFVEGMIGPIDTKQNHEEKAGADCQLYREWRLSDSSDKQAEILPLPVCKARRRPRVTRIAGASMTGAAARGHMGRVTKTDEFFLPKLIGEDLRNRAERC